jgi:hypothetical protein
LSARCCAALAQFLWAQIVGLELALVSVAIGEHVAKAVHRWLLPEGKPIPARVASGTATAPAYEPLAALPRVSAPAPISFERVSVTNSEVALRLPTAINRCSGEAGRADRQTGRQTGKVMARDRTAAPGDSERRIGRLTRSGGLGQGLPAALVCIANTASVARPNRDRCPVLHAK